MSKVHLCRFGLVLAAAVLCPAQVTFVEYHLPPAASGYPPGPNRIAVGPDRNLWFTEANGRVGRITPAGVITEFNVSSEADGITAGPDGNVWFMEDHKIGRITPTGVITEFFAAEPPPGDVTAGPDGNLWYTELENIVRLTPAGVLTGEFPSQIPSIYSRPNQICVGPDGNLWFTEGTFGGIGRITPTGVVTKFSVGTGTTSPTGITAGADGNLWFTQGASIGKITTAGVVTIFSLPQNMAAYALAVGPDGNLWFQGFFAGSGIGRVTPNTAGGLKFDFYLSPTNFQSYQLYGIVTGPDGNLWFTENGVGNIGRAALPGPRVINVSSTNANSVYGPGASIAVTIAFTTAVTVTGTPKLPLSSGGIATYTSGSGTNTLTFTYAVGAGQSTPRLDAASFTALTMNLNGGTIQDTSGNPAVLTLPVYPAAGSLGANKLIVISPNGTSTGFFVLPLTLNTGGNNGTVTTQISGAGFLPGVTVKLVGPGPNIVATPATVGQNGTQITITFDLNGAAPGLRDLVVTNPDGTSITIPAAFTIELGRGAEVWVDIIGRSAMRIATEESFAILYGNTGDVDAVGIPLGISGIPLNATLRLGFTPTPPPSYPGVPATDWSQLPVQYTSDPDIVIPLLISRIPPGSTGTLIVKITIPTVESFRLQVWTTPPYFEFLDSQLAGSSCQRPVVDSLAAAFASGTPLASASVLQMNLQVKNALVLSCGASQASPYPVYALTQPPPDAQGRSIVAAPMSAIQPLNFTPLPSNSISTPSARPTPITRDLTSTRAAQLTPRSGECGGWYLPKCCIPLGGILSCNIASTGCTPPDDDGCHTVYYCDNTNDESSCVPGKRGGQNVQGGGSIDPNDKIGASGIGNPSYLSGEQPLRYAIYFENLPTATLPAQQVVITDQLDPTALNLNTFSLGIIAFGDMQVIPSQNVTDFSTDLDLRPAKNLIARVTAKLDVNTGLLTWRFASLDPATGQPTNDPLAGFLPPDVSPPAGEGRVLFTVTPKQGLPTGTEIRNQATIVLDSNAPINTPQWLNTIDNAKPSSQVVPLAATQSSANFTVQWSGTDQGSGVQSYTIDVSENGGPFAAWLHDTISSSATFTGTSGKSYAFYSIARDAAGNLENAKSLAEASTVVNVIKTTPTITWPAPAAITYGTALSSTQLNATSSVPGSFTYSPASGAVLPAGNNLVLSVTFTPTDTSSYASATATVNINVNKATPTITWPAPTAVTYGTALSSTQLNATASTDGSFAYSPASGTILLAGNGQTLSVIFTPVDLANYTTATASTIITVNKAVPTLTWPAPAAITYGTALSSTQLNATATVTGSILYSPPLGAVLPAGDSQGLSATFTPADTANYATATASTTISVNRASASVTPGTASKIYGQSDPNPLTTGALAGFLASDNVTATYSRALGENAGTYNIGAALSPAAVLGNYNITYNTSTFTIQPATPVLPPPQTGNSAYGAQTILSVTISAVSGGAVPTGAVSFQFVDANNTTQYVCSSGALQTVTCPVPLDTAGKASVTTAKLPVGADSITATYSGDTNYAGGGHTALNFSVSQANTQTALSITPNNPAPTYGDPLTLAAQVSDSTLNSSGTPTGTVQFAYSTDNGTNWTNLGAPVTLDGAGKAQFQTAALPAPTPRVRTSYSGDPNFSASSVSVTQPVNPKNVTVTGITAQDKTYDGTTTATLNSSNQSLVGVINSDAVTLNGTATGTFADANAGAGKPVNITGLTLSGAAAANYVLGQPSTAASINRAPLKITADNQSATYGGALPPLTYTPAGLVNGETPSVLTGNPSLSTAATSSSPAGPYPITIAQGTLSAPNYVFSFVNGTLTVNKANASVTPATASKTYGAADPPLTGTLSGFLAADGITASYSRIAGETVGGSPYTISATLTPAGALGNYNVTYNTGNFAITKASALVTPNPAAKTYGAADPPLTGTLSGFLAADNVAASYNRPPGETVTGSPYLISATLSPAGVLGNYNITYNTASFTINKATASVTPNAASKSYGAADPPFTGTLAGFLAADGITASYSRTPGEAVAGSPYAISATLSPAGALANYNITYSTGNFTIAKAAASVTPNTSSKTYGAADPVLTGTLSGFLAADNVTAAYTRTAGEAVAGSPYPISATLSPAGVLGNYNITYNTASFTINKATASVTPNAASKSYGAADPSFSGTLAGFLAADGITASYSRTPGEAIAGSPYAISATLSPAGALANYNITYNTGNFTITKAAASVTPNASSKTYGATDPVLSGTLSGFLAADNVTAAFTRAGGETVAGSPYPISATLSPAGVLGNYNITYNTASFTINKATASVTPNAASKSYGAADPSFSGTLAGFLAADGITASYSRTPGEAVAGSPYAISATLSPAGALANYNITYSTGNFTITKAAASVTPNTSSKIYGAADPALTGTLSGFLAADNVTATYTRTAGETVAGSPYPISATLSPTGVLGNYNITYNTASLTINKATASVTPNAASKAYGAADPPLTGTLSGFLPADNVTATYSRTPGENPGPYTISATLSSLALANYNIAYHTATFTIQSPTSVTTTTTVANVTGQYSDSISLSATISAGAAFSGTLQFQVDGTIVGAAIPVSRSGVYTTSYLIGKAAGSYNISATLTPSTAGVIGSAGTGTLTVNKEDAVITPASGNPQSVKVPAPGGAAAPITLTGVVKEATDANHGDISKAVVIVTLVPAIAGGASVTCPVTNSGGSLTATCSNVPVEAYTVQWRITGNYYQGPPVDTTLAVYDLTLGFVTGAGSVMDGSASGDFAFDLQYKGGTLQGALTYLEHRSTGYVSVTTTSLISMSIVGNTAVILGRAVVVALDGSGLHELGTYPVQAIVVDNGEPGVNRDRFGLQLTGVSLNPPVTFAPATITAGNIQMH